MLQTIPTSNFETYTELLKIIEQQEETIIVLVNRNAELESMLGS
jgi:sulfur carrier protein ThiS